MKKRLSETADEQGVGHLIVNHLTGRVSRQFCERAVVSYRFSYLSLLLSHLQRISSFLTELNDLVDEDEMDSVDGTRLGAKRLFQRSYDEFDSSIFPLRSIYTKERSDSLGQLVKEKQPLTIETNSGVAAYRMNNTDFNFRLTEGQSRRGLMADCESECSPIFDFLFVGGAQIARSWKTLEQHGITRIINCSAAVVDNHFLNDPKMKYLSLNMVDGRQDDISWFLGDVLQFIMSGRKAGEKILIHCERGVSRSCSFAIAYHVWTTGASEFLTRR